MADDNISGATRFPFHFDARVRLASKAFGVSPARSFVDVSATELSIRFGLWHLSTPLSNVVGAETTGPYRWFKVAGPPHLSFADRGITFGTSTASGVCIRFREPVMMRPSYARMSHPGATVTVERPDELLTLLNRNSTSAAGGPGSSGPIAQDTSLS